MIEFCYNISFTLEKEEKYTEWLKKVIQSEGFNLVDLCYVFTDDVELRRMNKQYLNHDYDTDIITFDYTEGRELQGDIFISKDRVEDNAKKYEATFPDELKRVMVHGVLHLMGYNDKTEGEQKRMRKLEEQKMKMFHVEQ
ncbi:rRNA maturation RNase YbeY [Muriicola jejuensis]|uniref:Endoribonuclease YbeY n=1 Tax=Muriicola jejuensis TaxID=504488 RepID=A0A6P0UDD1_9FLAO|nr:rRNA maturation RNase YbeY [Muriicola jejuensis]NER09929.1 rRNA maturation RNase YbeY [Muriicola jejuensis]SMP04701.1 rRNA maturation RNase YbeY [Muriicola jejuensis]